MTADKCSPWKCYLHLINLPNSLFTQTPCVLCVNGNKDAKIIKITYPELFAEW